MKGSAKHAGVWEAFRGDQLEHADTHELCNVDERRVLVIW